MKMNIFTPIVCFIALSIGACQPNSKTSNPESSTALQDVDTVALVDMSKMNVAEMAQFAIDSLKMVNQFQAAANEFTTGYKQKKSAIYLKYIHPSIVKISGGKEQFLKRLRLMMKSDTQTYSKMITGPVKRVEAAIDPKGQVTGWYCLMPVKRWVSGAKENECQLQWLAGQCLDNKTVYFLDITQVPKEKIYQVMPDFHFLLDKELSK